jgi:signal transduction histidine kinase
MPSGEPVSPEGQQMTELATVDRRPELPQHARQSPPLWLRYVLVGAAVALLYLLIPGRVPLPALGSKILLYGGVSASAVAALVLGVRRHRPDNPTPWYLLIVAQLIYLLADLAFHVQQSLLHLHTYPAPADALYLGHYPFMILGMLLLVRSRTPGSDRGSFIDASIIAIGFGVLALVFLIGPTVAMQQAPVTVRLVSSAYPVMDMLVLAVFARLVVGPGVRAPAFQLFAASLTLLLATDTAYIYLQLKGLYEIDSLGGKLLDAGWLGYYLLLGAAALHPSMRSLAARDLRTRARPSHGRLAFLAGASLLAPAAIVVQTLRGRHSDTAVVAVACGLLFLLVVYRMSGLIREIESSAAQLRERTTALQSALGELEKAECERKQLLDKTLRGAEEEQIRIAAELHDGPIQRLTALGYQLEEAALTLRAGDSHYARELLGGAQQGLSGEIGELRGLMATLRPPVLDERGLVLALVDKLEAFERRTGIVCTLQRDHNGRLEPEIETVLYRVVQEALANVAKHAAARHVWVYLRADDYRADLQVRDDGVGFDPARLGALSGDGHFGLAGMRERVQLAGGTFRLLAAPGDGTAVRVRLPRIPA